MAMPPQTATLAAAISLVAAVGIGLSLSLPLLSVEMERMGVSAGAIGLNTAISGLASILIAPKVPAFAARFGVGRTIALALAGAALALLLFKVTMNYWAWMPLRFVFAAALGTLFVLSEFWIASAAPEGRRGLVMGIYATVLSLGFAIGPALLALVGTVGWLPYLAGTALFGAASLPLLAAVRRLPHLDAAPGHAVSGYFMAVPLAAAAGFASGALETGAIAILPVFGLRLGYADASAALMVSAVAVGNILAQIPLGMLSDRMDRAHLLLIIAAGGTAASLLVALAATPGAYAVYAMLAIWGAFVGGFYTVGLAHLAARFAGADLAGANAAFVVAFNVGLIAGPPVLGAAVDTSTRYGFASGAIAFCLVVIAARFTERRR